MATAHPGGSGKRAVKRLSVGLVFFHAKPKDWFGERLQNDLFCVEWNAKP